MKIYRLSIVLFAIFLLAACSKESEIAEVPIQDNFGSKMVYALGDGKTVEDLKVHCFQNNGVFNTCGSPCSPDAESCIEVCAYTCERLNSR